MNENLEDSSLAGNVTAVWARMPREIFCASQTCVYREKVKSEVFLLFGGMIFVSDVSNAAVPA